MVKAKRGVKQLILKRNETHMRSVCTRKSFCKNSSEKNRHSLYALRKRVSRDHLTSKRICLMCTFCKEEENTVVNVCILWLHEKQPLTIPVSIRLAGYFTC